MKANAWPASGLGIWGYDTCQAQKIFAPDGLAFDGRSAALVIIESRAFSQLLFEHPNFLFQVFDDDLLVAVYPAGKTTQQEGQGIDGVIIPSSVPDHEHFVGNHPVR